ncbi:SHOCT domain-containing protein [Salinigranum marinum]|uniref:SHOCT domain-containing protein n=1 Tax=Salinigranum marinum TaxID=1515595 RepID=UPI002989E932|nr:SHOCT domain-containing protein [Salinigranum marinum]
MTRSEPRVLTGFVLGTFLAFGADTLVIVAALWYVGRLSGTMAGAVAAGVLLVFSLWIGVRWLRLRLVGRSGSDGGERTDSPERTNPVDRLKQRYADGELSDAEFEARLDRLLDADRRVESTADAAPRRAERSRESE